MLAKIRIVNDCKVETVIGTARYWNNTLKAGNEFSCEISPVFNAQGKPLPSYDLMTYACLYCSVPAECIKRIDIFGAELLPNANAWPKSAEQVIDEIAATLNESSGDHIEEIANLVLGTKVKYTGDSLFELGETNVQN
jgi:hypothetical protein